MSSLIAIGICVLALALLYIADAIMLAPEIEMEDDTPWGVRSGVRAEHEERDNASRLSDSKEAQP